MMSFRRDGEHSKSPDDGKGIRIKEQLIRSTGSGRPGVSEMITKKDGSSIYSTKHRLERWAEHFEEQLNRSAVNESDPGTPKSVCIVNTEEPTSKEVRHEVSLPKDDKAPGPCDIHPLLFNGGQSLITNLMGILHTIWTQEQRH